MTLLDAKSGDVVPVMKIILPESLKRRLHMLGLTDGTDITVMRRKRCGTMIIKVRGVRYAIGKHTAAGIFVGGGTDGNR